jgi:hypothetical protein
MAVAEARRQLLRLAAVIEDIVARLEALSASLPESPERDAMYECLIPYDIPADLHAVAEVVRDDYLQPAVRALARAAQIDQATLDERFRDLL